MLKEIPISEKEFTETNYEGLEKALLYIKNNLIDPDGHIYLTVDSLIEIKIIINISKNTTLKKANVKSYGLDKTYMDKNLINNKSVK